MKVIGIQKNVEFDYSGNHFKGLNLFVTFESSSVEGVATNKYFMNMDKPIYNDALQVKLGDEIDFQYNRFGKPESLVIL